MNRGEALDRTLLDMYAVISFPVGGEPDWVRMRSIFHGQARITRITPEGIDNFDLSSFQAMAMDMLQRGVYPSFFEEETARCTRVFGSLAHVLSAYETKRSCDSPLCLARGVNSIQLVWEANSWMVLSLLWDETASGNMRDVYRLFGSDPVCSLDEFAALSRAESAFA
jgi:hypothetical protein